MGQGKEIHFVTFPDGKVDEASINIYSQNHAKVWLIKGWLPERFFGDMRWLTESSYALSQIWNDMEKNGFKVHTIDINAAKAAEPPHA